MMTFYQWLMKQTKRDTPTGDLAKDAKSDATFPQEADTKVKVYNYLQRRGACSAALDAFQNAWQSYLASKRRAKDVVD